MKITISTDNIHKFEPNFMDNLKAPKGKRFVIKLQRKSKLDMTNGGFNRKGQLDMIEYVKKCFVGFENPIVIESDGKERDITLDDIIHMPELSELGLMLFNECYKLNNQEMDKKK